ncbi:MAG: 2-amino-4-hydroxy-6-hydroxymethyldihydropteridine diphosphokinase [Candidatus Zixiibacteriota bacterium]
MAETVYLLLGSNIGDRERNLAAAATRLESLEGFELIAASSIYISEAVDMVGENPSFLNQVIKGEYQFTPMELLRETERIEQELGRSDKGRKMSRSLDCDILLFGETVSTSEQLTIPHKQLLHRPFALIPLLELDPMVVHPVTHKPIADYLKDRDRQSVLLYKDHVAGNR